MLVFAFCVDAARAEDEAETLPQYPVIYLDLRTTYSTVPAGTLALGFGSLNALPALSALSRASGQSITLDVPLTIDFNDRVSLFGGISASTSKTDLTSWAPLDVASWNIGFQADLFQQNGGSLPTVTWLSMVTKSAVSGPFATTSFLNTLELDYALDADATRGLLAGAQITTVNVDSGLASVRPAILAYVGAYYQWDNNWKLTARAGVQTFGGANTTALSAFLPPGQSLLSVGAFTQPVLRADLDKMDDNDNRLFGVTASVSWVPKPAYQVVLRTPLYLSAR